MSSATVMHRTLCRLAGICNPFSLRTTLLNWQTKFARIHLTLGRLPVKIIAVELGLVAIIGVRAPGSGLVVRQ